MVYQTNLWPNKQTPGNPGRNSIEPIEPVEPVTVTLPPVWVGIEELPILFANQFLLQIDGIDEILLSVGQVGRPPFLGTREERIEQFKALEFMPIRPVGRFNMTRRRLAELIEVLQTIADVYDRQAAKGEQG